MSQRMRRKNEAGLAWLQAAGIGGLTWLAMHGAHVQPVWFGVAVAMTAALLSFASSDLGVLASVIGISLPLTAANPIVGIAFLILGVASIRYLGTAGARTYLVLGLALASAFFGIGPVWAAVAIAGYVLGAGEGALAAALACLLVEAVGVLLGKPLIGVTVTGGGQALLSFANAPTTLLSVAWVKHAFSTMSANSVNQVVATIAGVKEPLALAVQPAVWALGAAAAGMLRRQAKTAKSEVLLFGAALAGVTVPAIGSAVVFSLAGLPVSAVGVLSAFAASLLFCAAFVLAWERLFPVEVVQRAPAAGATRASMAAEGADVDELLSLIASAEDKLASQHTTQGVVMITDMKSFSRMTEEDGSLMSAKAIQRHRDLLLPVIARHNGSGKSTGGDGIVAAFATASDAVAAATEAQRALLDHNESHPSEREIWIRMGIASGEVVLDKSGRPFIGAALNLAARVMNLADGGQIFTTGDVAAGAEAIGAGTVSFGEFSLKNIAKPVEVFEVLWADGQEPHDPRSSLLME